MGTRCGGSVGLHGQQTGTQHNERIRGIRAGSNGGNHDTAISQFDGHSVQIHTAAELGERMAFSGSGCLCSGFFMKPGDAFQFFISFVFTAKDVGEF